jgi:hypothetical protein
VTTPVFTNEDSTDWPLQIPGWTVQSAPEPDSTYEGPGVPVYTDDQTSTPVDTAGFTVQQTDVYAAPPDGRRFLLG